MFIKLKYLNGTHPGSTKQFSQPLIKIGRAPACDFALYDISGRHSVASRSHAELRCEGNELYIYDLNSSNGTFVNGHRVSRAALKNGDVLTFGPDGLQLQINFLISSKDETEFLSSCSLFQGLSWETLQEIMQRGDIKQYPAGSYLFRIGEQCSALYVIYSGLVEVSSVRETSGRTSIVGFLSSGDSLGESLALISGRHCTEARVEEIAEIFTLSTESLKELIEANPEFAIKFTVALCNRLNAIEIQLQARHASRKLQGDLHHFDLATIVQTLNGLRDTGLLALYPKLENGVTGNTAMTNLPPFARLYFEAGEVRYIRLGTRTGEEAFYQLFQMPLAGSFSFEMEDPSEDLVATEPIRMPTMNLLLEAHRLQDEIENLKQELPDLTTIFIPETEELIWSEEDEKYLQFAQQIWEFANRKAPLCEILGKADCCNFTTYRILIELIRSGQLKSDYTITELSGSRQTSSAMEPMTDLFDR